MQILFFGRLTDITGKDKISLDNFSDTCSLTEFLENEFPGIIAQTYRLILNGRPISENCRLKADDEIALLPPFSGG
jgi:sulfur-carrier protein